MDLHSSTYGNRFQARGACSGSSQVTFKLVFAKKPPSTAPDFSIGKLAGAHKALFSARVLLGVVPGEIKLTLEVSVAFLAVVHFLTCACRLLVCDQIVLPCVRLPAGTAGEPPVHAAR